MKDDIHNTIAIGKYSDTAVLRSLGEIEKAVNGKNEKKVSSGYGSQSLVINMT